MEFEEDNSVAEIIQYISDQERKQRLRKLMKNDIEQCVGCHEEIGAGSIRCKLMFDDLCAVIGKSTTEHYRAWQLVVATYLLQHPLKMKSRLAVFAHLGTIIYLLENKDQSGRNRAYIDWLWEESKSIIIPELPTIRGELTISSLYENDRPSFDVHKIESWALSVWNAYSAFHQIAYRAAKK